MTNFTQFKCLYIRNCVEIYIMFYEKSGEVKDLMVGHLEACSLCYIDMLIGNDWSRRVSSFHTLLTMNSTNSVFPQAVFRRFKWEIREVESVFCWGNLLYSISNKKFLYRTCDKRGFQLKIGSLFANGAEESRGRKKFLRFQMLLHWFNRLENGVTDL